MGHPAGSRAAIFRVSLTLILFVIAFSTIGARQARAVVLSIQVSGNTLIDGSGAVVIPHGVNRSGTEYGCIQGTGIFDGPSDLASVQAMKSWTNLNMVRLPLNEDCWLAINGAPAAYAGANYQNAIANYVDLLTQNGLYTILDLHWSAPGSMQATDQQPMRDADQSPTFWQEIANPHHANRGVNLDHYK